MDIEEIESMGEKKEHYIFIDSNDARFQKGIDTKLFNPVTQTFTTFIDTVTQRVIDNPANAYKLTFQQPFVNVIGFEILEAYIPVAPLQTAALYDTTNPTFDPLRYITIRVPEIESHLKRNQKDINWPFGMARIGWKTFTDIQYITYKKPFKQMREFHPIGKLQSVTIEFLKNNTSEYVKFQGFHHHILIAVTTMDPKRKKASEFPLQPNYDPLNPWNNYLTTIFNENDSDDEDLNI